MSQARRSPRCRMRPRFLHEALLFLLLASVAAGASPAHGLRPPSAETGRSDASITLTEQGIALADLAEKVSRPGRIRIRVSPSLSDLKVTVAVREASWDAFRISLAAAVDGVWRRRHRKESTTYLLERDPQTILRAAKFRESETEKIAHDLWHRTRQFLEPQQPVADEIRGRSAAAALIAGLGRAHWAEIMHGRPLVVPFGHVPAELSEPLRTFAAELPSHEGPVDTAARTLLIRLEDAPTGVPCICIYAIAEGGIATSLGWAADPESTRKEQEAHRNLRQQYHTGLRRAGQEWLFERRVPTTFRWKGPRSTLSEALVQIRASLSLNLVSDYHTKRPQGLPEVAGLTWADALERVGEVFGSDWRLVYPERGSESATIVFRNPRWPLDDLKEVPNRLLKRWDKLLHDRGWMTLDEVAEIGALTDDQLGCLLIARPQMGVLFRVWPFLRFYQALSPGQRRAARSPGGLDLTQVRVADLRPLLEPTANRLGLPDSFHWMRLGPYVTGRFWVREEFHAGQPTMAFRVERDGLGAYAVTISLTALPPGRERDRREGPSPPATSLPTRQ